MTLLLFPTLLMDSAGNYKWPGAVGPCPSYGDLPGIFEHARWIGCEAVQGKHGWQEGAILVLFVQPAGLGVGQE